MNAKAIINELKINGRIHFGGNSLIIGIIKIFTSLNIGIVEMVLKILIAISGHYFSYSESKQINKTLIIFRPRRPK